MKPLAGPLWRIFPWDPSAAPGGPFSPEYVQPGQTSGRFDLQDQPPILYLAESPDHAAGEKLQRFRGRRLHPAHLREFGHGLAVVSVVPAPLVIRGVADLTHPGTLERLDLRPDVLASRDRRRTQGVARRLFDEGFTGLHWWSAITGDWHATVLFLHADRAPAGDLAYGVPERLTPDHPAVIRCADVLGMER